MSKCLPRRPRDWSLSSSWNLENPGCLKILLDGQASLEERFAQIDVETVRKELGAAQGSLDGGEGRDRTYSRRIPT
jgi:hypothetical protein